MTPDVFALSSDMTVKDTVNTIANIEEEEPIYNVYVIDPNGVLVGYISLWELIKAKGSSEKLGNIAHKDIISAATDMDQEEVAKLMSKYDLATLPVVDSNNKLVGRITMDDVMDVIEEEATAYPLVDRTCPKCSHDKAYFWEIQTRASDEPATQFFKCEKCKHTWRHYD